MPYKHVELFSPSAQLFADSLAWALLLLFKPSNAFPPAGKFHSPDCPDYLMIIFFSSYFKPDYAKHMNMTRWHG